MPNHMLVRAFRKSSLARRLTVFFTSVLKQTIIAETRKIYPSLLSATCGRGKHSQVPGELTVNHSSQEQLFSYIPFAFKTMILTFLSSR